MRVLLKSALRLALLVLLSLPAHTDESRYREIVVAFGAGGRADQVARGLANEMNRVVISNYPGEQGRNALNRLLDGSPVDRLLLISATQFSDAAMRGLFASLPMVARIFVAPPKNTDSSRDPNLDSYVMLASQASSTAALRTMVDEVAPILRSVAFVSKLQTAGIEITGLTLGGAPSQHPQARVDPAPRVTPSAPVTAQTGRVANLAKAPRVVAQASAASIVLTQRGGAMSPAEINACSQEIMSLQVESQSWSGDVDDVAERLGTMQKEMFETRCARHPEAKQYIAGAVRMIRSAGSAVPESAAAGEEALPAEIDLDIESDMDECLSAVQETGPENIYLHTRCKLRTAPELVEPLVGVHCFIGVDPQSRWGKRDPWKHSECGNPNFTRFMRPGGGVISAQFGIRNGTSHTLENPNAARVVLLTCKGVAYRADDSTEPVSLVNIEWDAAQERLTGECMTGCGGWESDDRNTCIPEAEMQRRLGTSSPGR